MINKNINGDIVVFSRKKELKNILKVIQNFLNPYNPSNDFKLKINLVIEEIFINIIKHGYKSSKDKEIKISYMIEENPKAINIKFVDKGILFNPCIYAHNLEAYISNVHYKGGLGIIIIKSNVDEISYKSENNCNILSIKKIIV
ncbi:MAG: ATP-binding protein [Methanobrevibacter sp.]|jgi:anti-sigma regulatory factor (Ser/Thr protein kinase)|nr:ATP-binding protein [Candidatus Methanovirga australis]